MVWPALLTWQNVPECCRHNDLAWNIRNFVHNKLTQFNFSADLRQVPPWSRSSWSQTDLPRLQKGQVGAQVSEITWLNQQLNSLSTLICFYYNEVKLIIIPTCWTEAKVIIITQSYHLIVTCTFLLFIKYHYKNLLCYFIHSPYKKDLRKLVLIFFCQILSKNVRAETLISQTKDKH